MSLMPIALIVLVAHFALIGTDTYLTNIISGLEDHYGTDAAFLPGGGASDHPYDRFSDFLSGDDRPNVDKLENAGGLGFFQWAVRTPMCTMSTFYKFLLSSVVLNYDVVKIIPTEGWGLWVKTGINLVGTLINIGLILKAVTFALRAGIFSNPTVLALLGLATIAGFAGVMLDGLNVLGC